MRSNPQVGEKWKHWKGTSYTIVSLATHSDTDALIVVYRRTQPEPSRLGALYWHFVEDFLSDRFSLVTNEPIHRFAKIEE